ncbi:MAG TPA: cytochrome c biogenesis protein CcdA [Isosphaeraceae bacterium]|jgi:thiol:disulfide interchange protein DsbD|nr:cytochrome c biogenesis protein CcdA [Isosphaeraceae bacterium]
MRNACRRRNLLAGLAALAVAFAAIPAATAAEDVKPARKDSRIKPQQAQFTTTIEPAEAAPGDTVTLKVTAKVDSPWHIYAYAKKQADDGPVSTHFDLFDKGGLEPVGDWKASAKPIRKKEPAFPTLDAIEFHEESVTWSLKLKVPDDAKPGKHTIRNQIEFQLCDPKSCLTPTRHTLPAATVTVKGKGSKKAAAASLLLMTTVAFEAGPAVASPGAPKNEVQAAIEKGLFPFLLTSAFGGLLALLMPCVWPMVPVTVNFFIKQGQAAHGKGAKAEEVGQPKGRARTTGLAITYCLAIIGIFTLVGVAFSAFLGASSIQRLATNAWLNLAVALIFIAFGLSLLGLYEIGLPSFLLNASSRGESRGGLVGVFFMALTLTITSFTCTFPVVGGLIVIAAQGQYFYPVIGLMTFATVLALPFFLLALAPGLMTKLPKSGDWMNAVKVVGGLVEIGAAFKFLNAAEIGFGTDPADAWIDSYVMLTSWVVLALICGVYLLGFFKTGDDQAEVRVGPGRLLTGAFFLGAALYLTPALFGFPPRGQIYNHLVVGLLGPDADRLAFRNLNAAPSGGETKVATAEPATAVKATSKEPEKALREEKTFHGVQWGMSYDEALERAKAERRPVLIDFTGVFCANCRQMESGVMPRRDVVPLLQKFVTVQLYTDQVPIATLTRDKKEELAADNLDLEKKLTAQLTSPLYVVLSPEGKVLAQAGGYIEAPSYIKFLTDALSKFDGGKQVAQAETSSGGR